MKKISNNKFRNNAIYSLNYKFDSVSSAGKFSGTALDLIKKYNELAKEAQNNGDYVGMEVFRQYAEHYRKIVTDINERKNQNRDNIAENEKANVVAENETSADNELVETEPAQINDNKPTENSESVETENIKKTKRGRGFTVVEVAKEEKIVVPNDNGSASENKPHRRTLARKPRIVKKTKVSGEAENAAN